MRSENEKKLEELIHRELSQLPLREAPETLIPRVMQAIQDRCQRKWWQRPWTQWPLGLQIASLPVMCFAAAAIVTGFSQIGEIPLLEEAATDARQLHTALAPFIDLGLVLVNAAGLVLRALSEQWFLILGSVAAIMWAAFIGVGTACLRLAAPRR